MDDGRGNTKHGAVKGSVTFCLLASSVVACISGSFQFGYQLGVLTGPSDRIRNFYNESQVDRRDEPLSENAGLWLWSTTVSVFCIGGALGALSSSYLADFLGRKGTMLFSNLISIFGALFMGLSYTINYYEMVIVGRFVIGLYGGLSITIVPIYLIEISPANLRGGIAIIHQVILNCGLLIAQILGIYVFDSEEGWPILVSLTAVPSIIQLFILPFCPESPRWLFIKEEDKCRQALMRLRGTDNVVEEMDEIKEEAIKQRQSEKVGLWDVLMIRNPDWKKPLIISVCVHAGQQLTGINAILFYSRELYELTGLDDRQTGYAVVGTGVICIVTSIISIFLVDKLGRRALLLYSVAVVTVSSTVLAFSISFQDHVDWLKWISLGMVYLFIVAFHFGAASIPFVIVPELWSQGPRAPAMSISAQANWYSNFLAGLFFPYLLDIMTGYTFLIFAMCSFLYTLMTAFYVPETKGRTFEQITASFKSGQNADLTSNSGSDETAGIINPAGEINPAGIINPAYQKPEDTPDQEEATPDHSLKPGLSNLLRNDYDEREAA